MSTRAKTSGPNVRSRSRAAAAVLRATERLLEDRPLNELSVADIVRAAGISRTSFYAHYASKTAVIAECLRQVIDEVMATVAPFLSQPRADPETAIRVSLEKWVELCTLHGALVRAVSEEWPHDEELRQMWFEMLATVTDATAQVVRAARQRGDAPAGADPEALAACLIWTFERALHVALVGDALGLPDPEVMVEPLSQVAMGGLFGRTLGDSAAPIPSPPPNPDA